MQYTNGENQLMELRKEAGTLLQLRKILQEQLNRLKVEELAINSYIREEEARKNPQQESSNPGHVLVKNQELDKENVDNDSAINQTKLQLDSTPFALTRSAAAVDNVEVEEEEEEDEDEEDEQFTDAIAKFRNEICETEDESFSSS
uniref:snRNA-activating protein complex subunit 5 n=1 Tax=Myxine glutinosa TaxID=7769 RepID=UPI00358ED5D3